jgi:dCTP deaminase
LGNLSNEPVELYAVDQALKFVIKSGLPLRSTTPDVLLHLNIVQEHSLDASDKTANTYALNTILSKLISEIRDPTLLDVARILFGINLGMKSMTVTQRREKAAAATGYSPNHIRTEIEPQLRRMIAIELTSADAAKKSEEPVRKVNPDARRRPFGVLTDDEIIAESEANNLIASDFKRNNVQQACYELRAGNIYYDLSSGAQRITLSQKNDFILLKPHQLIVVITKEALALPADVVGRILMKGKLFSLGLQPVNTYADPGFSGKLGIVIYNSSPNYVRLDDGAAIAKIEFERLAKPVSRPYSGQHGYQTEIWPIPTHMILRPEELVNDARISSTGEEMRRAFGDDFGAVVDRVFRYERLVLLSVLAYTFLAVSIIAVSQAADFQLSTIAAFALGLVTNLASSALIFLSTNLRRRRK